ncbi:MAG: DNA-protecting protein DprA [Clostridia bacterium]|nr:DNA-protecting protein DprA [Clostridia bacterium]
MKIEINDKEYPKILNKIDKPPKQLYIKGNIQLLKTPAIAIIGSRKCSEYGEKMAKKFSRELSLYGLTIISGLAKGIDSYAHSEALEVGGNTIAVLPSGFKNIFPKCNQELYEKILNNNGLIISEYQEEEVATSNKFLERNRIVSGLSIGILVVEGGYRSGTSVTAKIAKKDGKKIFCIPSSLENSKGITTNRLIKESAFLVMSPEDIINKYPELNLKKRKNIENSIKDEYKEIYNILKDEVHIDEIARKVSLSLGQINYQLMMLEIEDKIVSLPGNYYKRK